VDQSAEQHPCYAAAEHLYSNHGARSESLLPHTGQRHSLSLWGGARGLVDTWGPGFSFYPFAAHRDGSPYPLRTKRLSDPKEVGRTVSVSRRFMPARRRRIREGGWFATFGCKRIFTQFQVSSFNTPTVLTHT